MTAMPDTYDFDRFNSKSDAGIPISAIKIDETYWGYVIWSEEPDPTLVVLGQAVAWLLGAGFAVAALGLWVMPSMAFGGAVLSMKLAASTLLGCTAALLLWFASRGGRTELQVDTSLGEVREIVRNRAGRPSLVGRYGFDAIGSVFLDRSVGKPGEASLVMRYRNTTQIVSVVHGTIGVLETLRDRLGRDLMTGLPPARRRPAIEMSMGLRAAS